MNIKDCPQTVDGIPVMIYNTQAGGNYPIHGAFWERINEQWIIQLWTESGEIYPGSQSIMNLDLTDWKEWIPWICLVDEIEWVAIDEDREWFGYEEAPKKGCDGWYKGGAIRSLESVKMPKGPADWKQAIAQRPESEKNLGEKNHENNPRKV